MKKVIHTLIHKLIPSFSPELSPKGILSTGGRGASKLENPDVPGEPENATPPLAGAGLSKARARLGGWYVLLQLKKKFDRNAKGCRFSTHALTTPEIAFTGYSG